MLTLETSAVNLIVGWKLFSLSRNASSVSLSCIQFISMSSINLSHENDFILTDCRSVFQPTHEYIIGKAMFTKMAPSYANDIDI